MPNTATIIVAIIVFALVALDIWYLFKRKKQGKGTCSCGGSSDGCSSCSGGCSGCSGCH